MAGLTESGFVVPTLEEILSEREAECKRKYGTDFQASNDNLLWQQQAIDANREYQTYLLIEAVYKAQTVTGAEGIYLDDYLGLRGIYRNGATASNGYAVIEADQTVDNSTLITSDTTFNANTGVIYRPDSSTDFTDRVVGMLVAASDFIGVESYTFTYTNPDTGTSHTVNGVDIDANNSTQITNFFNAIVTSVTDNTSLTSDDIFVTNPNTSDVVLHFGYTSDNTLVGIATPSNYTLSPELGIKAASFFVTASKTGVNPLSANGIISVSPSNVGFVNVTNTEDFATGSEVEADTVYRLRAASQRSGTTSGSEARIIEELGKLSGVTDVKIFANPTTIPRGGVAPLSFETVVSGGVTSEIAETIYRNKALTDNTDGEITYGITTASGESEDIKFSRAVSTELAIRVSYLTTTSVVLSNAEQENVKSALVSFSDTFSIGGTIFNANLQGIVFSTLSANRLANLIVETKDADAPDSEYTQANITAPNNVIYVIDPTDITFTRI